MRYSKRELKDLPIPEEIIVENLAEYISLFSDGKFTGYLFRGEPTNYPETVSSALREDPFYSFVHMKKEFKREVWHKLSPDERTHFSAFSQHHGIPTNLIDITTSPLVSLYFACQKYINHSDSNEIFDEKRGFVYLFENKFVDITNILTKYEDDNILELFAYNKNNIFIDMYEIFLDYKLKYPQRFRQFFENLNAEYRSYFDNTLDENPVSENVFTYIDWNYDFNISVCVTNFIKNNEKFDRIYQQLESVSDEVFLYTAYLQLFLRNILNYTEPIFWFNIMPNFKYAPILTFERGRNQQGLFIYQTYLHYIEETFEFAVNAQQRVWPNKIIVINNKEKILKELDFIGINEKFIYGDYDNIASYIKRKFG
ncbi:FRG domain-containing protein [Bacillus cereus]|uniref:FRG domain-containing protein n=1 Tax=Bacillus cereus TaxID=1396 RepID=UPI0018D0F581|nr:FRG domain-containing protein [Bacillus cereus]MBH0323402.1 FRG domain-containing protein [Bacillus cereus]